MIACAHGSITSGLEGKFGTRALNFNGPVGLRSDNVKLELTLQARLEFSNQALLPRTSDGAQERSAIARAGGRILMCHRITFSDHLQNQARTAILRNRRYTGDSSQSLAVRRRRPMACKLTYGPSVLKQIRGKRVVRQSDGATKGPSGPNPRITFSRCQWEAAPMRWMKSRLVRRLGLGLGQHVADRVDNRRRVLKLDEMH